MLSFCHGCCQSNVPTPTDWGRVRPDVSLAAAGSLLLLSWTPAVLLSVHLGPEG